jgi:hypothetical protein
MDSPFGGTIMKRIREFLESIVFAGMKPGGQTASKPRFQWLGPLRGPIERLLSGGPAPNDPLYLTNRTLTQKLKPWSLVAIPCLILAVAVGYTLRSFNPNQEAKPVKALTAAEIAAKMQIPKDIKLAPASEVQVLEIRVDGSQVVGTVLNTSAREIAVVKLVIDLTGNSGSQVGAVEATLEKLPASGRKNFQLPIRQRNAAFALIREISIP